LDKKWKTTVLEEAGKNAVWNQTFELHIESLEDQVKFICYDEDALTNDLVGELALPVNQLCRPLNQWFDMTYKGGKSAQIHISTKYTPPMEDWPNEKVLTQDNSHPNLVAGSILKMLKSVKATDQQP
jgi:Ca2+-dependent lipid-binding protein